VTETAAAAGGATDPAAVATLAKVRPFDRMERAELEWAAARLRTVHLDPGDVLARPGEAAERVMVLLEGAVEVDVGAGARAVELVPGDCLLLEEIHAGRPVLFGYRARTEARLGALTAEDARALLAGSAAFRAFAERRARKLFSRLERLQEALAGTGDSVMSQVSVQRVSAEELTAAVRHARSPQALTWAAGQARDRARLMAQQGVAAGQVTRFLSAFHDQLAQRVLALEVEKAGLAGDDFCWLAFGSEGRTEQTLRTDQDNGIVFDPGPGGDARALRARLLPLAGRINEALAACGFPLCSGGIMAGNPDCCLSVEEWKGRFAAWIERPSAEALLHASVFLDLRPVWGNRTLGEELRRWIVAEARRNSRFLPLLGRNALQSRPPLGRLWGFSPERSGPHAGTIDLKRDAIRVFVDAGRALGLSCGSLAPGTEQRLRDAGERARIAPRQVEAWVEAFQYVQVLRLRLQRAGQPDGSANRVAPAALNELEQRFLLEALRQAQALQGHMARSLGIDASA
jgi:signal-transduction protein with cAMP-binding, CBS, and nucleotidyltransferase domain